MLELSSSKSMNISLEAIRLGNGGLDAHRKKMLARVPESNNWAKFPHQHLAMKDLAYLTAKTGHEFAILRGKSEDILFHGSAQHCKFDDILVDMLLNKRLRIIGHSHPGENIPIPSQQDRETLILIGQEESQLISGRTGKLITFTPNLFDDIL